MHLDRRVRQVVEIAVVYMLQMLVLLSANSATIVENVIILRYVVAPRDVVNSDTSTKAFAKVT